MYFKIQSAEIYNNATYFIYALIDDDISLSLYHLLPGLNMSKQQLCLLFTSTWNHPRFCGWVRVENMLSLQCTGTCFIQKMYAPSSSLLQGKHQPFTPSPLRHNIFRLFVILSLTQLYRYTPEIFLFSTATFKYTYRAPLRRIGQEYSAKVAFSILQSLKRIQSLPVRSKLI